MVKTADYILKFNPDFYDSIRENIKEATTRASSGPVNIGDFVIATFEPSDKLLLLRIDEHYARKLKDLTRYEAKAEGYYHEDLLKHELKNIYPTIGDDDYVYFYRFINIREKRSALQDFRSSYILEEGKWVAKK